MSIFIGQHGGPYWHSPKSRQLEQPGYGYLYPETLHRSRATDDDLDRLASASLGGPADKEHPEGLPAGYTFVGQFIAHDLSFDVAPHVGALTSHARRVNRRTPRLDLDSLYGYGPQIQPYLYQRDNLAKLLLASTRHDDYCSRKNDLPRLLNGQAVVADPRNDENHITAQLHVAFVRFHNSVVDLVRGRTSETDSIRLFLEARRIVVWHYQWLVAHDFLPKLVRTESLREFSGLIAISARSISSNLMPFEFSLAAFRLHTLLKSKYDISPGPYRPYTVKEIIAMSGWAGGETPIPSKLIVDWRQFFRVGTPEAGHPLQTSGCFDPWLVSELGGVIDPTDPSRVPRSLARTTLERGQMVGLPSGQAVANYLGLLSDERLNDDELNTGPDGNSLDLSRGALANTPLWYYVMREAELRADGAYLGPVGSHIVASTILGLLASDPNGYWTQEPAWTPHGLEKPGFEYDRDGDFTINDLLRFDPDLNPWATVWA